MKHMFWQQIIKLEREIAFLVVLKYILKHEYPTGDYYFSLYVYNGIIVHRKGGLVLLATYNFFFVNQISCFTQRNIRFSLGLSFLIKYI